MKKTLFTFATAVIALGIASSAEASITLVSSVGGQPSAFANYVTFDVGTEAGAGQYYNTTSTDFVTVSITPDAGLVTGSSSGRYAAPYLSGNNGVKFGLGTYTGQDNTRYGTSGRDSGGSGAKFEIAFNSTQRYFGLLWGSVDTYNTLKFYNGTTLVGTVTGSDVTPSATGDQGSNGTYYVNMNSDTDFNRVEISSSQYAFEFDNIAYSKSLFSQVPEPSSMVVWSVAGLAGLVIRRRRS